MLYDFYIQGTAVYRNTLWFDTEAGAKVYANALGLTFVKNERG